MFSLDNRLCLFLFFLKSIFASSTEAEPGGLTIDPSDRYRLTYRKEEKVGAATDIMVKQLKEIQAPLVEDTESSITARTTEVM